MVLYIVVTDGKLIHISTSKMLSAGCVGVDAVWLGLQILGLTALARHGRVSV